MKITRRSPWRLLYKFHRYTGLAVGLIIIMLSITGIILNHTSDLLLDRKFIQSPLLLDWYGITPPELTLSFPVQGHWLSQSGQQIFLDSKPVYETEKVLIGVAMSDSMITVAFNNKLLLLTSNGEVIEQIDKNSIERIGSGDNDRIYLKIEDTIYYSDDQLLSWQFAAQPPRHWSTPGSLPLDLREQLKKQARHAILSYERVTLDIHSGRFFGPYGPLVIDLAGLFFILLAISGTWIWLKHVFKHRRRLKDSS